MTSLKRQSQKEWLWEIKPQASEEGLVSRGLCLQLQLQLSARRLSRVRPPSGPPLPAVVRVSPGSPGMPICVKPAQPPGGRERASFRNLRIYTSHTSTFPLLDFKLELWVFLLPS